MIKKDKKIPKKRLKSRYSIDDNNLVRELEFTCRKILKKTKKYNLQACFLYNIIEIWLFLYYSLINSYERNFLLYYYSCINN